MNAFTDNYGFYVLFVGCYQAVFATVIATTVIPLVSRFSRCTYGSILRDFALLNVFLLVWGGLGNALWLHLTANRLSVADDCPVWAPFVPFSRWVLDSAGGWQLYGGATIGQLQWLWAAIAIPVWLISFSSASVARRLFLRSTHRLHAAAA